ncbi:MAG: TIGR00282 family metallophosphoesterase [Calditerrivibrio sp.]|nr:TIGR00282 family metallophosphoesterase [Calditerrivibrio sp.]
MTFNVLFLGDIIGRYGRSLLKDHMRGLIKKHQADLVIANGENAAGGFGLTKKVYDELKGLGIDVITTGNHVWDKKEFERDVEKCDEVLRPQNVSSLQPGKGFIRLEKKGVRVSVLNLMGRVYMPLSDCPFKAFDSFFHNEDTDIIIVDFHAEATSEKNAFAFYVDGRATAVIGTHTHVQTNDDRILPKGTFYITDVGMCGGIDSVIGMNSQKAINRFISGMPDKNEVELKGRGVISGVIFSFDLEKRCVVSYNKIYNIFGEKDGSKS